MTPIDLQIDPKVTISGWDILGFRDSFADPVPKRPRIDFGGQKVTSLSFKSDPLGSKSDFREVPEGVPENVWKKARILEVLNGKNRELNFHFSEVARKGAKKAPQNEVK